MEYIITQELERQQAQGFIEEKKGKINPNLSFQILLDSLGINVEGLRYRENIDFSVSNNATELSDLPFAKYLPFHQIIRRVIPIIGEVGVARAAEFWSGYIPRDDCEGWEWREGEDKDLKSALKAYRFGEFSYQTRNKKSRLEFHSDTDPNEPFGTLEVYFNIKTIEDIPIEQVRRLESNLRGLIE